MGDARLDRRLRLVAGSLARDPSWSIPHATGTWAGAKGAYRFLSNPGVKREAVLEGHIGSTVERAKRESAVLVVEDTTYLNYTHHPKTRGLGPIGTQAMGNKLRGTLVHSALAVTVGDHRALGLLGQEVLVRDEECRSSEEDSRVRRQRPRESRKWMSVAGQVLGRMEDPGRVIFVFDREGDIFDVIGEMQDAGARFVIRGSCDRRIETTPEGHDCLFEAAAAAAVLGRKELTIPAGGGRKERKAAVGLRARTCKLLPPHNRDRLGVSKSVNVLDVREEAPPTGADPLHWILLTTEPIECEADVLLVMDHYCGRWKIEEWHKVLKTGCRIEDRQLETWQGLEVLLGLLSVMAWRLLALRDAARVEQPQTQPAEAVLTETQEHILRKIDPALENSTGVRAYLLAIAKLGGFLGRKRDGHPGWLTLWRGFTRLRDIELGFSLNSPSCAEKRSG